MNLPVSHDIEQTILANMLNHEPAILQAMTLLKPEMFDLARHSSIFKVMMWLFDHQEPIGYLTVAEKIAGTNMDR
ncbi:MAG: DnaB-like helicase N-terminal domain-containing protein [bacterium]